MSDALTDIRRSEKIAEFMSKEIEPIVYNYWNGKISKEECIVKLRDALNKAPCYTGYWGESPTLMILRILNRIENYGKLGLIKSHYIFEFNVELGDSKDKWCRELERLKQFISELNKVVEVIEEYLSMEG